MRQGNRFRALWGMMVCIVLLALPYSAIGAATVTVTARVASAGEGGPFPGIFELTRHGDLSSELTVAFSFAGTATFDADYLVWETHATFFPGAGTAFVTVLPRNDSVQEGDETVIFTLTPGVDYTVGTPDSATVTVGDVFVAEFAGIFDRIDFPTLEHDLTYLDAAIINDQLNVQVALSNTAGLTNVHFFLDTDQNPLTGDGRAGHVAGVEYRITALAGVISDFQLFRLPRNPEEEQQLGEQLVLTGTASTSQGFLTAAVPLAAIGNPTAVDVFATTFKNIAGGGTSAVANGDRAPDYGTLDTATRQVVVRQPGITQVVTMTDPAGDISLNGFDLVSATIATVADQFIITLEFAQPFDPSQPLIAPGPRGVMIFDSDRSLSTGGLAMGVQIPTWGGDALIRYDLTTLVPVFVLQAEPTGRVVVFGEDRNDGRWLGGPSATGGGALSLAASLSVLDAFFLEGNGEIDPLTGQFLARFVRIATDGQMYVAVTSEEVGPSIVDARTVDALPGQNRVVDTASAQPLEPFMWDPNRMLAADDPRDLDLGGGISGIDLVRVEAQVIETTLVLRGILSTWLNTDVDNTFEMLLDTDMNEATGVFWQDPQTPGGPGLGADYIMRVVSLDTGGAPVYAAVLEAPNGFSSIHEAMVIAQPSAVAGQPGSFTVTIPWELLGELGPRLRLFMTTGQRLGVGRLDTAPSAPMVLDVPMNPGS